MIQERKLIGGGTSENKSTLLETQNQNNTKEPESQEQDPRKSKVQRILVACEESQRVTIELRKLGHKAYSCDIDTYSGGHPEWHIQQDVLPLLNGNCTFTTCDGKRHDIIGKWDMILAFPPCNHLAVSGAKYFEKKRADGRQRDAIEFFCQFLIADCDKIAIENPIGIISGDYTRKWFPELAETYNLPRKPSQIIQPYMFGEHARKSTCLWLKGLPNLQPTNIVDCGKLDKIGMSYGASLATPRDENGKTLRYRDPLTAKIRSKTFPGIAKAMATQWTC